MKVICISGKAMSGKDTAANYFKNKLEESGKRVLITHYADLLKYICKTFFGWDGRKDEKGRRLLQYIGTDVVREQNPNYWVDFLMNILNMFQYNWDYVLIPDCRFPNEITRLKRNGFNTASVKIIRDDFDNGLTETQKSHESETSMDNFDFDFVIHNKGLNEYYEHLDILSVLLK